MVRICVAEQDIRIITPHKVLTRYTDTNIDELVFEVVSRCNDSEIELVCWNKRYEYIQKNPGKREIEQKLSVLLTEKNVRHVTFDENTWEDIKKQINNRKIEEVISKEDNLEAEDPFA